MKSKEKFEREEWYGWNLGNRSKQEKMSYLECSIKKEVSEMERKDELRGEEKKVE